MTASIREAEDELREQGFVREGIQVDLDALYAFLAPLAEPSRLDTFKFSREWLRGEAARVTDPRSSNLGRRLNLPPSYVLIHRVSTEGIGVLCQLESEGPFRAEMIRWMPGYAREGTAPRPAEAGRDGPDPPRGTQPAISPAPAASGLGGYRPGRHEASLGLVDSTSPPTPGPERPDWSRGDGLTRHRRRLSSAAGVAAAGTHVGAAGSGRPHAPAGWCCSQDTQP